LAQFRWRGKIEFINARLESLGAHFLLGFFQGAPLFAGGRMPEEHGAKPDGGQQADHDKYARLHFPVTFGGKPIRSTGACGKMITGRGRKLQSFTWCVGGLASARGSRADFAGPAKSFNH
jgi:hypothetical protein